MLQISHSPFLQALGYALIHSLWQFALLWLIYVLINSVVKLSCHQKYIAGMFLQAGGFFWFTATFFFNFYQYYLLSEIFIPGKNLHFLYASENISATLSEIFLVGITKVESCFPYLSILYMMLLFFFCLKWLIMYKKTQILRVKGLAKIDINWRLFVKHLSAQLGIKYDVKIFVSELVKTPLTVGFFKPFILIPLASLNNLSPVQMEAVILHELAHIKRFDYVFNLFIALIETTLFFNPFMISISRHIKRERENCCDDWVLQYNYNAASYAGALLQIATCQSSAYLLTLKAADNNKALFYRIKRMIEKREINFFNYSYQVIAFLVLIIVSGSMLILSDRQKTNNHTTASLTDNNNLVNYFAKSDNVPLNPNLPSLSNQNIITNNNHLATGFNKINKAKSTSVNVPGDTFSKGKKYENTEFVANNESDELGNQLELFANEPELVSKNFENDLAVQNLRLDELNTTLAALEQKKMVLNEEKFKKLMVDFVKQNKVFINQKQIFEEMKKVLQQLKAAKLQLQATENPLRSAINEPKITDAVKINSNDEADFKIISKKIQQALNELKVKCDNAEPLKIDLNYQSLPSIPNFDLKEIAENPHSFSFEFSEKPGVRVLPANSERPKTFKKRNISPTTVRKITLPVNISPFQPGNEALKQIIFHRKSLRTIRI